MQHRFLVMALLGAALLAIAPTPTQAQGFYYGGAAYSFGGSASYWRGRPGRGFGFSVSAYSTRSVGFGFSPYFGPYNPVFVPGPIFRPRPFFAPGPFLPAFGPGFGPWYGPWPYGYGGAVAVVVEQPPVVVVRRPPVIVIDEEPVVVVRPQGGGLAPIPPPPPLPKEEKKAPPPPPPPPPPPKVLNDPPPPALPPPAPNPRAEYEAQIAAGRQAFRDGAYGLALQRFRAAIAILPEEPQPQFLLLQAQLALGKYHDAHNVLLNAMRLRPDWPTERFRPLELYGDHVADYAEHLDALEEALARFPRDPLLLTLRGYQLWFDGCKAEAADLFRQALPLARDPQMARRFLETLPDGDDL